jgi:transposase
MMRIGGTRIYAYCAPIDARKGFEGLAALVREEMGKDPLSGALFLFTNRRRSHAKVLWFDGSGMCVLSKRLERGRFPALWECTDRPHVPLKRSELELFLEGSELVGRFQVSPPILSAEDLAPHAQNMI